MIAASVALKSLMWSSIESQNHRMVRVGRDHIGHLVPIPPLWAVTPSNGPGCSKPHPTWPWTLSRSGASTTSLGNLFQCLTTLRVKTFFLMSNLNLPSFSLNSLPLVLSLYALVKSPSPAFLCATFRYWKAAAQSAWSHRLNIPNSLSLSS